jgi:hypothetical protein
MKRNRIYEQNDPTAKIIQAPKNEVQRFESGPIRDKEGTIVNLCNGPNGNPKAFRVGGKTYFIAKQTPKGNFLVYDGRVLQKGTGDCEYKYMVKEGKIAVLNGVSEQGLESPMKERLLQFGIDPDSPKVDLYYVLGETTKYLQEKLVNQGAVSDLFKIWNEMLMWYYPNDFNTKILKPVSPNTTLDLPSDNNELTARYKQGSGANINIKYNNGPFEFWLPKNANLNIVGNKVTKDAKYCSNTLATYLINGLQVKAGGDEPLSQLQTIKSELSKCYATGAFDDFAGFTEENMDPGTRKKLSPYGFLNKKLNFREIKRLLKSDKMAPSHNFDFDNVSGNKIYGNSQMNENVRLKSIIKNKLSVLSEGKQKRLISETKIIQSRFNIISESKMSKDRIATKLFNESFDMVNLGMNEKLITEGLMDALKGMFGFGAEGIVEYFKEKLTESLIKKLGFETDEWLSGIIIKGVGNIPVGDWFNGKVFHCDYLVPLFAKTVVEQSIGKAKDKAGLTGGFYDVLRNALVNGLEETSFGQSVERGLTTMLCPYLTKIGEKMGDMFNTMKQKSIS